MRLGAEVLRALPSDEMLEHRRIIRVRHERDGSELPLELAHLARQCVEARHAPGLARAEVRIPTVANVDRGRLDTTLCVCRERLLLHDLMVKAQRPYPRRGGESHRIPLRVRGGND